MTLALVTAASAGFRMSVVGIGSWPCRFLDVLVIAYIADCTVV